jgi:hypothetical protein
MATPAPARRSASASDSRSTASTRSGAAEVISWNSGAIEGLAARISGRS